MLIFNKSKAPTVSTPFEALSGPREQEMYGKCRESARNLCARRIDGCPFPVSRLSRGDPSSFSRRSGAPAPPHQHHRNSTSTPHPAPRTSTSTSTSTPLTIMYLGSESIASTVHCFAQGGGQADRWGGRRARGGGGQGDRAGKLAERASGRAGGRLSG